mgnify:CR=1 FL=1
MHSVFKFSTNTEKMQEGGKMGFVIIDNDEYKNLILKEKELEDTKTKLEERIWEYVTLEENYDKLEKELKELILIATDNETSFYRKLESYDIKDTELAKYLNKYYLNNKQLEFRKRDIEEKIEEEQEEE